ncbi:Spy/CpxP family protein refolding chaperone [Noviherbaspirillum saxi]|nr:Spy/CpxP family protein refolding chaperone [Noviherbaspirillum saxi]
MTTFRKRLLAALLTVGLTAGSFAVYAEKPGQEASGAGPAGTSATGEQRHSPERMRERMEKRAAALHDKLKLNASQEAAWQTYIARMKPADRPQRPDRAEFDKLTAPERMEKMLGMMKQAEQRMTERLAATKEFYAVLTPEQQKIFDEETKHRHGRHHGRHHGGHHGEPR